MKQGHQTSTKMVARLLKELGYSLQANRKRLEGAQHPDRNAQFEHLTETIRRQVEAVRSRLDERTYAKGRRVSNAQLAQVNLEPHVFHGEWNYTIHPTSHDPIA